MKKPLKTNRSVRVEQPEMEHGWDHSGLKKRKRECTEKISYKTTSEHRENVKCEMERGDEMDHTTSGMEIVR